MSIKKGRDFTKRRLRGDQYAANRKETAIPLENVESAESMIDNRGLRIYEYCTDNNETSFVYHVRIEFR